MIKDLEIPNGLNRMKKDYLKNIQQKDQNGKSSQNNFLASKHHFK